MDPFMTVADLFSRSALHGRANSALPNAPVQPHTEPRRVMARLAAHVPTHVRRPTVQIRRPRYTAECPSP
jgi:hypothetical protein